MTGRLIRSRHSTAFLLLQHFCWDVSCSCLFLRVNGTVVRLCRRFLNRLLGLPVARQNLLFSYFACTLTAEIRAAKAEGRYFEGVSDLSGSNITEILKPKVRTCSHLHALLLLTSL